MKQHFDLKNHSNLLPVKFSLFLLSILSLLQLNARASSFKFTYCTSEKDVQISYPQVESNLLDCNFLITKAICNANGTFTICAENSDPTCPHSWILKNNNSTVYSSASAKFCTDILSAPPNDLLLTHACSQSDICNENFIIGCNPDCSALNFSTNISNCSGTFTINNPNSNFYTWTFGDGSSAVKSDVSSISHTFPVFGGNFEICVTWSEDLTLTKHQNEIKSSANRTYFTCCYTVNIPDCVECESPSVTWEKCPTQAGDECCIDLTFHSPYTSLLYRWDIYKNGQLEFTQITATKTLKHNFIGRGPRTVCVTFYLGGYPFECCYVIDLPPCDCCETADFSFETIDLSYYNTCVNRIFEIKPVCKRTGMSKHKWIFSDGVIIWRDASDPAPPDHIFTNYINTTGEVCVTHEIYCDNQLQDAVTKCKSMSQGAYLGVKGQVLNMSDILFNLTPNISVFQFISQNANISVPLLIDGILTNNINTSFTNGFWWMAKGSQININSNTSFGLTGTQIRTAARVGFLSCCRWKGIKAQPRTTLNWDGTTISDAEIMLETVNSTPTGARLNFKNNNFLENIMGIKSVNHRFTCGDFHNNTFTGCKECNVLCGCSQCPCIYIDMTGGTTLPIIFPITGAKNSISSYDQGFEVYNLNMNVKNFDIFNITLQGIYYEKSIPSNRYLVLDLLTFDNMQIGIVDNATGGGTHTLTAVASVPYVSLK